MNNFIFENRTKIYCGRGCVKEYLCCLIRKYGKKVLLAYGSMAALQKVALLSAVILVSTFLCACGRETETKVTGRTDREDKTDDQETRREFFGMDTYITLTV